MEESRKSHMVVVVKRVPRCIKDWRSDANDRKNTAHDAQRRKMC